VSITAEPVRLTFPSLKNNANTMIMAKVMASTMMAPLGWRCIMISPEMPIAVRDYGVGFLESASPPKIDY
jgi:hypothetical protein